MVRNRLSVSGRAIERQPVFEMRLAAEGLEVWIFPPGRTGLLVAQPLHVLEQMQPGHALPGRRCMASPKGGRVRSPGRPLRS